MFGQTAQGVAQQTQHSETPETGGEVLQRVGLLESVVLQRQSVHIGQVFRILEGVDVALVQFEYLEGLTDNRAGVSAEGEGGGGVLVVHLEFVEVVLGGEVFYPADGVVVEVEFLESGQLLQSLYLLDLVVLQPEYLDLAAVVQSPHPADLVVVEVQTDDVLHILQVLDHFDPPVVHVEVLQG